jgi:hypothetical protein
MKHTRLTFQHGLNENEQPLLTEAFKGSYNFELSISRTSLRPRVSFDSVGVTTNAGDVRGFMQLVKTDDTSTTLVQSGDVVYSWDGSLFTSVGVCTSTSQLRGLTWTLGNYMIITDVKKATVVKKWDGTTYSSLSTGLTNPYAKYGVVHNNRVWLFNLNENATDLPHVAVASAFEDPTDFTTALRASDSSFASGLEAFYLVSPDLKPINGVAVFQNQLIISTVEGQLFKLTGSTSVDYAFTPFYLGSAAVGTETIKNVGNDVFYMKAGGNIESLRSTDAFGDVTADDLSRWIQTSVNGLSDAITVYDQTRQTVMFFVAGKILVLFKDILVAGQGSPWSIYTTEHPCNFTTNAAQYMRIPGTTSYTTYFGGATGEIYNLNGTGLGDGGSNDVVTVRKTRHIDKEMLNVDFERQILTGRIRYRRLAATSVNLNFAWSDTYLSSDVTMVLKGPPQTDPGVYYGGDNYYAGAYYYNTGFKFADQISTKGFSPAGKSPGFQLTIQVDSSETFQIDEISLPDEAP